MVGKYNEEDIINELNHNCKWNNSVSFEQIKAMISKIINEYNNISEKLCIEKEYHKVADSLSKKNYSLNRELSKKEIELSKQSKLIKNLREKNKELSKKKKENK